MATTHNSLLVALRGSQPALRCATAALLISLAPGVGAHAGEPAARSAAAQFVRSRDVLLELRAQSPADQVTAWLSRDNTETWTPVELARPGDATYCFTAPADGAYDFYFVLTNDAGPSDEPPRSGTPPHASIVVDTTAPIVQFRELTIGDDPDDLTAYGRVALIDDDRADVRLFYRNADVRSWRDAGALTLVAGRFAHPLPATDAATIDLCIVATDRAGNTARDERLAIWLPAKPAATYPQSQPAAELAAGASAPGDSPSDAAASQDALSQIQNDEQPHVRRAPSAPDRDASFAQIEQLRAAAAEFAARGQHGLAVARLRDALRLAPGDVGLLGGLGKSEYELGDYDAATGHFEEILKAAPDNAAGLEGLALTAATQHRYPLARDTLLRLLEKKPAARYWLNYGDVEYRLGNTAKAQAAWESALKQPDADAGIRTGVQRRLKMVPPAGTKPAAARDAGTKPPGAARSDPPRK